MVLVDRLAAVLKDFDETELGVLSDKIDAIVLGQLSFEGMMAEYREWYLKYQVQKANLLPGLFGAKVGT